MPSIGKNVAEMRVRDASVYWRIIYRPSRLRVVVAEVFPKKTGATPKHIIDLCRRRFAEIDRNDPEPPPEDDDDDEEE
jgi:phage-related protein